MDEPAPGLRASDADRERTAFTLRTALSEGRITLEEFDQRVATVYSASTYGDLAAVTADLPTGPTELGRRPAREVNRAHRPPAFRSSAPPAPRSVWARYLSVNLVCFVVWACIAVTTQDLADLWFLWVAGPWGAVLAAREVRHRLQ
jgi:hypothetical protein